MDQNFGLATVLNSVISPTARLTTVLQTKVKSFQECVRVSDHKPSKHTRKSKTQDRKKPKKAAP